LLLVAAVRQAGKHAARSMTAARWTRRRAEDLLHANGKTNKTLSPALLLLLHVVIAVALIILDHGQRRSCRENNASALRMPPVRSARVC
jgi:hypothetical protein